MKTNGFTLIEILVSLSLMTMVVLGFAVLQTESLHVLHLSRDQDIAMNQLQNAQQSFEIIGKKSFDQAAWQQENENQLPKGQGSVRDVGGYEIIKLCWQGRREFCREVRVVV